uniref:Uncharacterized protein n=1 Tax=Aegilops tauschii TaxID=37682 RepID=M8B9Q1_AEGTA
MATVPSKPEPLSDVSDLNLQDKEAGLTNGLADSSDKNDKEAPSPEINSAPLFGCQGACSMWERSPFEAGKLLEIVAFHNLGEESLEGDKVIDIGQKVLNALDDLPAADLAPFLACDDIEGNPNPWVQVEPRGRRQGAHTVAPVDNTGDVDGLGEQGVDEFEDVFWLTKIRQHRVSRRSTKSRPRALVGVRSGPGVFVFNY